VGGFPRHSVVCHLEKLGEYALKELPLDE